MAELFANPWYQPLSGSVETYPGAKLYFYQTGTTTAQNVYTDAALSVAHANPVVADAAGRFDPIYLDPASTAKYKAVLKDSADTTLLTVDPVSTPLTDLASTSTTSDGAALVGYKHGGSDGSFTTGAVASTVQKKLDRSLYVQSDFGTSAAAIQAALDAWRTSTKYHHLVFEPGDYTVDTALTCTFTANSTDGKTIEGYGANLINSVTSGTMLSFSSQATVRYLHLLGLQVEGDATNTANCILLDGGNATQFLYGVVVRDVRLDNFLGHGILANNNFFEAGFWSCQARASASNTTGVGFKFDNATHGVISSIDMYGCMTVGGLHGVHAVTPVGDIKIHGGTFIEAEEYGIKIENAVGALLSGVHVENNWESATVDVSSGASSDGGAGIYVSNDATIIAPRGTTNANRYQKYVVETAGSGNKIIIVGGVGTGSTYKFAKINPTSTASVMILGHDSSDVDGTSPDNVTYWKSGRMQPTIHGQRENFVAYAATVAPNIDIGSNIRVGSLTGNIQFNAPTASNAFTNGDEITFRFVQDGTGSHTVTFATGAGAYVRSGTSITTTASTTTIMTFQFDGDRWYEKSISTGM